MIDKKDSILDTSEKKEDKFTSEYIRPMMLDDFIGQTDVKNNLKVFIVSAKRRK